jgi:FkbM family methyltransferase
MSIRLKKTIGRRLPFYTQHFERALWRGINKLNKRIRAKNYPAIACVPTDPIGQCIVFYGLYEEELLCFLFGKVFNEDELQRFKQQQAIDVGANIGNHTLFFARYFKEVIAFEPNISALKLLDANICLNKTRNVQVFPFGLSHEANTLPFLENSKNLGISQFQFEKVPETASIQYLRVEKGDSLLQEKQMPIALIKLDIEGHELNALRGLEETIRRHQPIILFELGVSNEKNAAMTIFNYLRQLNYAYFYTIEQKKRHPFFLMRFFEKLRGYEIVLEQIIEPEDRYYALIIAKMSPLE